MYALPRFAALAAVAVIGLAALASTAPVAAATYTVGVAGGCSHVSLSDALAAATANPDGPHLIKERNLEIMVGGVNIAHPSADITIEGGYNACTDDAPAADGQLVVRMINPGRVMTLTGGGYDAPRRTLTLKRVTLTGGDAGSAEDGGGVLVGGSFQLHLSERALVTGNTARDGGGVFLGSLSPDPATQARLLLDGGAVIERNQAHRNGGGVQAFAGARIMLIDGQINRNRAGMNGGAVHLQGSTAELAIVPTSTQSVRLGANAAGDETAPFSEMTGRGGAIYSHQARIFSNHIGHPGEHRIRIDNNNANHGGAIFVSGPTDGDFTSVELRDTWVHNNHARGKGGAFYSRNSVDWVITHDSVGPCIRRLLTFTWREPCSRLFNNGASNETTPNTPGGGVFYLGYNPAAPRAIARVRRTLIEGNHDANGLAAVVAAEGANEYFIERSLMRDNHATGAGSGSVLPSLLYTESANSWLLYSTLLDNEVERLFVFGGSKLTTRGSIFWAPGTAIWDRPAAVMDIGNCLLSHNAANLPAGAVVADPLLDADGRPMKRSPAWDYCDGDVTADANGYAAHDIPGVTNAYGPNDLGAYELADAIFINGMGFYPNN